MTQHTPGPWTLKARPDQKGDGWTRIMHDDVQIAKVTSIHPSGMREAGDFDEEDANARLIAAAPELLDALEELQKRMWQAGLKLNIKKHSSLLIADAVARTAIFKATGGTP